MSTQEPPYDLMVIGSGPGGHAAALTAAGLGAKTAIVEKGAWGGTCVNIGCIPTKALLACSGALQQSKKFKRLGIRGGDGLTFDFSLIKKHQDQMVRTAVLGVRKSLTDAGIALIEGTARILSPTEIEATAGEASRRLETRNIVIAWGSESVSLPGIPFSNRILHSGSFLTMKSLPSSVVIVGAGNIGIEFATFLAELGCRVKLVELLPRILPLEDEEASRFVQGELVRMGVEVLTSAQLHAISEDGAAVRLKISCADNLTESTADYAIICTGRRPVLHKEELTALGIAYTPRGIVTDDRGKTNIPNIYAVGDVSGGMLLAHRAAHQGMVAAEHLFGDTLLRHSDAIVPAVTYCHPNVARVGLTEWEAAERGIAVECLKSDFGLNMFARIELCGSGFVKFLFHENLLVGATIAGEQAAELIAPMSLAIASGLRRSDLKQWILAHPTLSEVLSF